MSHRTTTMVILSIISVIILGALFFLSGKRDDRSANQVLNAAAVKAESSECFQFDPETLSYDGEGDLDLLYGVTFTDLTDSDGVRQSAYSGTGGSAVKRGQELRDIVFVRISAGKALYQKNITYTAQLNNGETVTAVRPLRLEGYARPKITLPDDDKLPRLTRETMDSIQYEVMDAEGFKADDGFGRDARDHIEVSYATDRLDSSLIHYTYKFTNLFNDEAVSSLDMELPSDEARIVLSTDSVTITQEDTLHASDYVVRAVKADGSDGKNDIQISGKIDQSRSGSNTINFDLEDVHMELTVIVVKES